MNINSSNGSTEVNFQARFFYSDFLKKVADYAVKTNNFDKLNRARKNIAKTNFNIRLLMDYGKKADGSPYVEISRYIKKNNVRIPQNSLDYNLVKQITIETSKHVNPLRFALNTIIKLGNNAPENNLFKRVVINK